MHRSSSYYLSSSSSSSLAAAAAAGPGGPSVDVDVDQLPTYDPQSDAAKKEALDASRASLAHALVHLVPVVVLLCGLVLWSLSSTTSVASNEYEPEPKAPEEPAVEECETFEQQVDTTLIEGGFFVEVLSKDEV